MIAADGLTERLADLYPEYRGEKRDLYSTGLVPEGTDYRGRVWRGR